MSTGIAFRQQQFAQRSSLLVASDSRCQTTTARYKCNRVANTITLNPPHLLKKIVPTILMCRRFRENQSERGGKAFTTCVNIERTLAVGLSQEFLNGFDIFSIRLQQRRFSTVPAGNALSKLAVRARTLASLDAVTGLRVNELLALGRGDINLENLERRVTRSLWHQVLGRKPRHISRSSAVLNGLVGSESPGT